MRPPGLLRAAVIGLGVASLFALPTRGQDDRASATVRGIFGPEDGEMLSFVDGFAWLEPASGVDGQTLRLYLTDHPLDLDELDRAVALELELELQCDECSFAELEIDARDAAWLATRYRLPDGSACGGCETSPARRQAARLRFDGRRLRGSIEVAANDAAGEPGLELTLDLPVATLSGVGELPADGGEPARALEICRAAVRGGHAEGVRSFCFTTDRVPPAGQAVAEVVEGLDALAASTLRIDGGRVRGDRALLRVETVGAEGRQRGVVLMVRTPSGWRHRAEKLRPVWED